MKAQRAEASAKRFAAEAAWRRLVQVQAEARRPALEATKLAIRDRGDKVHRYTHGELVRQAEEMIGPWLVVQAKANIAQRTAERVFVKLQEIEQSARRVCRSRKPMTNPAPTRDNRTLRRLPNSTYRPTEYLTEAEVERLIDAARKRGRNGTRDAAAILLA
jgi:hypothetical protein